MNSFGRLNGWGVRRVSVQSSSIKDLVTRREEGEKKFDSSHISSLDPSRWDNGLRREENAMSKKGVGPHVEVFCIWSK